MANSPEAGNSPQPYKVNILNDFNTALGHLQTELKVQEQSSGTVDPKLAWLRNTLFTTKPQVESTGSFKNNFKDLNTNEDYEQTEGIPVEDLIDFLNNRAQFYAARHDEYVSLAEKLAENSISYISIPDRLEDSKFHARVQQEAYFISQDERNTGSETGNWLLAEQTIKRRRELMFKPEELETETKNEEVNTTDDAEPEAKPKTESETERKRPAKN